MQTDLQRWHAGRLDRVDHLCVAALSAIVPSKQCKAVKKHVCSWVRVGLKRGHAGRLDSAGLGIEHHALHLLLSHALLSPITALSSLIFLRRSFVCCSPASAGAQLRLGVEHPAPSHPEEREAQGLPPVAHTPGVCVRVCCVHGCAVRTASAAAGPIHLRYAGHSPAAVEVQVGAVVAVVVVGVVGAVVVAVAAAAAAAAGPPTVAHTPAAVQVGGCVLRLCMWVGVSACARCA